jgi:hypothetical protein
MKNTEIITVHRKIGSNRGSARLWLEGKCLSEAGWKRGDTFYPSWSAGNLCYVKSPDGARKVAGTDTRPIIDTNTNRLLDIQKIGEKVMVQVGPKMIIITPDKRPL